MARKNADIDLNAAPIDEFGNIMIPDQDPHPVPPPPSQPMEMEHGGTSNPRHVPEHPLPPQCMAYIYELQEQFYKVSMENEMLRLEIFRLRSMLNTIHVRTSQLTRENEALKLKIQEASVFFR